MSTDFSELDAGLDEFLGDEELDGDGAVAVADPVAPAKKARGAAARVQTVTIEPIDLQTVEITVKGVTPLIVNRFDKKAREEILGRQVGAARQKQAPKDPQAMWYGSFYRLPDGTYGFPVLAFKACAIRASNAAGTTMTKMRQAFHVWPDDYDDDDQPLVRLIGEPDAMKPLGDVVKLPGPKPVADIHFRGYFSTWEAKLRVQYNKRLISLEQLMNLFNNGGWGVGVGEHRPERNGMNGMFTVVAE